MKRTEVLLPGEIFVDKARLHFLRKVEEGDPIYPYFPRHVAEVEKWAKRLLQDYPEADREVTLVAVWLHDIGNTTGDRKIDHAVQSEIETRRFLGEWGWSDGRIEQVAHCVRAHRCDDVQPQALEAKILAAADSASHMTDFNYIVHMSEGLRDYTQAKLDRDFRDISLLSGLQEELTPLYLAWKQLLGVYPDRI